MLRWLFACALLVACHPPRAHLLLDVEQPPAVEPLAPPAMFGPVAQPASAYNEPLATPVASTPLADAVAAALEQIAHHALARDGRLDLAADELAAVAARGAALEPEVLDFALRAHGLVESTDGALVAHGDTAEAVMAELAPQLGDRLASERTRIGIGATDGLVVVVAVRTPYVTIPSTFPRWAALHSAVVLHGTLDDHFHAPSVVVAHDDRRTVDHPLVSKLDRQHFEATIPCDRAATAWILVEGHDPDDKLTRLALLPLHCGAPPRTAYRIEPPQPPPRDLGHRLLAIVNRERLAAGLPLLRGDVRVTNAARRTAEMMRATTQVGHLIAGTTTADRLRASNVIPPIAKELVLHAPTLAAATEILMNERGYAEGLLASDVTHAGAAITRDAHGELFIAIELVEIIQPVDVARLRAQIVARINATRQPDDQLVPLEALDIAAQRYALERSRGWSDATATTTLEQNYALIWGGFKNVHRALSLLVDGDATKVDISARDPYDQIGIGVAQSPRNGALAGRVWVIVLFGKAR